MSQTEQTTGPSFDTAPPRAAPAATRIDAAHVMAGQSPPPATEPVAEETTADTTEPTSSVPAFDLSATNAIQQIRSQATQLASHLQRQQASVDHREAELNARLAAMENQIRGARLWLNERQTDLAEQTAELERRKAAFAEREASWSGDPKHAAREAELDLRESELNARLAHWTEQLAAAGETQDARQLLQSIESRHQRLDEAEKLLATDQDQLARQRQQLTDEQTALAETARANQQKLIALRRRATADHVKMRREMKRHSDELAARRGALERMRAEVARAQQETLEVRLATEELWARLCGTMAPAALTQSLARIRLKLADQQRLARAELVEQRAEVQALSARVAEQHQKLSANREEFQAWATERQQELEKQAGLLAAGEERLEQRLASWNQQQEQWQKSRGKSVAA